MNEELTWLSDKSIADLFMKYDEDKLREVINWIDEQPKDIQEKIKPIMDRELTRRASLAYEEKNRGEWI